MAEHITIRSVVPEDFAAWKILCDGYNAFYGREGPTALPLVTARGRGAGRALIDAVSERARTGGAARVYWHTHETNALAMRLYDQVAERSGFVVYRQPL